MKNEGTTKITVKSSFGEKAAYTASGAIISTVSSAAGKIVGNVLTDEAKAKLEEYDIIKGNDANATKDVPETEGLENVENENGEEVVSEYGEAMVNNQDRANMINNHEEVVVIEEYDDIIEEEHDTVVVPIADVDDNMTFSEAFAAAREQVGAGGVFEWHGRAFHTYYANEWNDMSALERAEFQASIDYNEVMSDEHIAQRYADVALENLQHVLNGDDVEIEVSLVDIGSTDINDDGVREDACIVDIAGNEVLIVDVDNDGFADLAIHDANANNIIDEGEVLDISEELVIMPEESDLIDDSLAAVDDDTPDYMNNANVDLFNA